MRRASIFAISCFFVACASTTTSPDDSTSAQGQGGTAGHGGAVTVVGGAFNAGGAHGGNTIAGGTSGGGQAGAAAGSSQGATGGTGGSSGGGGVPSCTPCLATSDCGGGVCTQLPVAADTFCFADCSGNGTCTGDAVCMTLASTEGQQSSVCVPAEACGASSHGGAGGSGAGGPNGGSPGAGGSSNEICGAVVGPDVSANCSSCGTSHPCQANGCYGGWYCNTDTNKCQPPPSNCPSGAGGSGGSSQGAGGSGIGGAPQGTVGPGGGTVDRLFFAIVGDTRPPTEDDTKGYPSAVASKIWQDVAMQQATFGVTTGDYMFASPTGGQVVPQLQAYLKARSAYGGTVFSAMGNHECTGQTASNCGPGTTDGATENYTQFLSMLLGPLGQTKPYYSIDIASTSGAWTAKFVFVAANAWTSEQGAWLDQTLSQATTYTFVVRHESDTANTAPGVDPSNAVIAKYPLTIKICGHTHTYEHLQKEKTIIVGNGGAPLASNVNYGYVIAAQRDDGAIVFTAYDYATNAVIDQFAVDANGNPA